MSFQKNSSLALIIAIISSVILSGCGSSAVKQRKEERNRLVQSSKMYCEFVNGEVYANDVEVALNIDMAKRCDAEKPFSITPYKTPSETQGIIYCCSASARGGGSRKEVSARKSEEQKKSEDSSKSEDETIE